MRKGKHCSLKVRSVNFFIILKMSKVTDFSNHIVMKLLLEDVKFDENILAYEPNSVFVPSSSSNPYSTFVSSFVHILASSSSNDDNEDENPPSPTHLPPNESIEPKHAPAPRFLDGSVQHEK
jgi:hypothetical protein